MYCSELWEFCKCNWLHLQNCSSSSFSPFPLFKPHHNIDHNVCGWFKRRNIQKGKLASHRPPPAMNAVKTAPASLETHWSGDTVKTVDLFLKAKHVTGWNHAALACLNRPSVLLAKAHIPVFTVAGSNSLGSCWHRRAWIRSRPCSQWRGGGRRSCRFCRRWWAASGTAACRGSYLWDIWWMQEYCSYTVTGKSCISGHKQWDWSPYNIDTNWFWRMQNKKTKKTTQWFVNNLPVKTTFWSFEAFCVSEDRALPPCGSARCHRNKGNQSERQKSRNSNSHRSLY